MTPPPADQLAPGILLGTALRAQSDRRLVRLVRDGYEVAFEEIVRRYRKPLDRFAAAIVGSRSEDVTQDAFSKALLALRGSEQEIELRPWLYRIVRNTALNDLRDRPPEAEQLTETIQGARSAAEEVERHEELTDLTRRLQALPEPQRAAIVMRELEGLSHEEIAAALGVSGGAARQAIYRARGALRGGLGLLLPLPLVRLLLEHGGEAAASGAAAAGAGAAGAAGAAGGGAAFGGLGAGGAVKAGLATALIAGGVGAGVALEERDNRSGPDPAAAAPQLVQPAEGGSSSGSGDSGGASGSSGPGSGAGGGDRDDSSGRGSGGDDDRRGDDDDREDRSGSGGGGDDGDREDRSGSGSRGSGGDRDEVDDDDSGRGRGRGRSGEGDAGDESGGHSGSDSSGGGHSGSGGGDDDDVELEEAGDDDDRSGHGGSDDSGSGESDSSDSGSGSSSSTAPPPAEPAPEAEEPDDDGEDSSGSGSGDEEPDDD